MIFKEKFILNFCARLNEIKFYFNYIDEITLLCLCKRGFSKHVSEYTLQYFLLFTVKAFKTNKRTLLNLISKFRIEKSSTLRLDNVKHTTSKVIRIWANANPILRKTILY